MYILYYAFRYNHDTVVGCRVGSSLSEASLVLEDVREVPRVPFFTAGKEIEKNPGEEEIEKTISILRRKLNNWDHSGHAINHVTNYGG